MKKILVINVNWIGDVIFSSCVFHALKNEYPGSHISCLAPMRVQSIVENIEGIDEFIAFDERAESKSIFSKIKTIIKLKKDKYDLAFILHRSLTRALIAYCANIPIRVGYNTKNRGFLLTHKYDIDEKLFDCHRAKFYLNLIEKFGITIAEHPINKLLVKDFYIENARQLFREKRLEDGELKIILNAGGNWDLKRWPIESFALLAKRIAEVFKAKVILVGSKNDQELSNYICSKLEQSPIVFTGKTDLNQLLAIMKLSNLVISADSGPIHLANAVGVNVVSIFGPTRPEITGPIGLGKSIILQADVGCNREACYFTDCNDNVCMKAITVDDVIDAARLLLK